MKIIYENLGVLKSAEMSPRDFTVICGDNNSGKTYAVYAWFGFLSFFSWRYVLKISPNVISDLKRQGVAELAMPSSIEEFQAIIDDACQKYIAFLPTVFAASEERFSNVGFKIILEAGDVVPIENYNRRMRIRKDAWLNVLRKDKNDSAHMSWIGVESEMIDNPSFLSNVSVSISRVYKNLIFSNLLKSPYIFCAERTGVAVFRKDLDTAPQLSARGERRRLYRYPLPIVENLEMIDELDLYTRMKSPLLEEHPELGVMFDSIAAGTYEIDDSSGVIYFVPQESDMRLTMDQSASSVRAMMDLYFYIKHIAHKGDIVIIDEPELNLHPSRQIRLARLLTMLANVGVKVMITTHSDYIVREINNMCVLAGKQKGSVLSSLLNKYGVSPESLIDSLNVALYTTVKHSPDGNSHTLVSAQFDEEYGFVADIFDSTLDQVISFQGDIRFSVYD